MGKRGPIRGMREVLKKEDGLSGPGVENKNFFLSGLGGRERNLLEKAR